MSKIAFLFQAIAYDKFGKMYDASYGFSCPEITPRQQIDMMLHKLQTEFYQQHNHGRITNQATVKIR